MDDLAHGHGRVEERRRAYLALQADYEALKEGLSPETQAAFREELRAFNDGVGAADVAGLDAMRDRPRAGLIMGDSRSRCAARSLLECSPK